MAVTMDPDGLRASGAAYTRNAEELNRLAGSTPNSADLRRAFAGAGETVWPSVEVSLVELTGQLARVCERTAHAGSVLTTAAEESTAIDRNSAGTIPVRGVN